MSNEAAQDLARAIVEDGNAKDRAAIEGAMRASGVLRKGERIDSETAHRIAAHAAREADRNEQRRRR